MNRFTWKAPDGTYQIDDCMAVHKTLCYDENFKNPFDIYEGAAIDRLGQYEDIGATPDELKTAVSLYLEMSQKMRKIVKDMKYYLDANEEDGVIYIPKFVIEKITYG